MTEGLRLPSAATRGCAAFDSESGYVYYIEGDSENGDVGVYRVDGEFVVG